MNAIATPTPHARADALSCASPSVLAKREMSALPNEPFWLCAWKGVVFLHFEVPAKELAHVVPFELDLYEGRAFVSLVAFTLSGMRPRVGGRMLARVFRPFGTHRFLNLRIYVRHDGRAGIYFLREWLDAPWLNLCLGPFVYGLPFHPGRLRYRHDGGDATVSGEVVAREGELTYHGEVVGHGDARPSIAGSLDAFVLERYRAFTLRAGNVRWFPVWHAPWRVRALSVELESDSLLKGEGRWANHAKLCGAHHAPGADDVWMGRAYACG